jgi:hypothetical protein
VKRTTKTERRRARRNWPGACQDFGTAWAARLGRQERHHLPLRVASALRVAPWLLFEGVPKPAGVRRYPVVAVATESWPQARRVRWTRMDTMAWYVDEATIVIEDDADDDAEVWLRATEASMAELWTRGPYDGA